MRYQELLRDPRWQKKRLSVMNRDGFACRCCGDIQTTLNVHHLKYKNNPWEVDDADLLTLCKHCHELIESEYGQDLLINEPFLKFKKGELVLVCAFTTERLDIFRWTPDFQHVYSMTHGPLKTLLHFAINHWIKTGNEDNLIDFKIQPNG